MYIYFSLVYFVLFSSFFFSGTHVRMYVQVATAMGFRNDVNDSSKCFYDRDLFELG